MFIFDAIPLAGLALFMETDRVEEFSPLKNKEGVDSIQTCREGQVEKFSLWLEAAGLQVPRDGEGRPLHKVEISPLYAMDRGELASKAGLISKQVEGDLLLA
jgi:UDP-N-acetylglucosamine/UDP-N-acetylgalactosamine diphosphorylase